MKLFRVVTERDGETTKERGTVTTQIERQEYCFAARDIEQVWKAIHASGEYTSLILDRTIIAIVEEAPAVIVLGEAER